MRYLMQTTDISFIERESSAAELSDATTTARTDAFAEYMRSAIIFEKGSIVVPIDEIDFSQIKPV